MALLIPIVCLNALLLVWCLSLQYKILRELNSHRDEFHYVARESKMSIPYPCVSRYGPEPPPPPPRQPARPSGW